jgi:hypothetical protein
MPSLKEDASFIEFLALGATATERTIEFLNERGHEVIELERGARSTRIWKHKEKQLRVPDLLCLECGRKIESRGKKNLEITMSHSTSDEERTWDYDADDEDWVALVKCTKQGEHPRDWSAPEIVNIVSYDQLRETVDMTKQDRSGATQGYELTITWPSTTASANGIVKQVTDENRIQISRDSDNYTLSYNLEKKIDDDEYVLMEPQVYEGDRVTGETEFIAAPFELMGEDEIGCPSDYSTEDYVGDLDSDSFSDRFAAIKALGYIGGEDVIENLEKVMENSDLNPFVQLEAAASLAKIGHDSGWKHLEEILKTANDDKASLRLEVAIILGEIDDPQSEEMLLNTLDDSEEVDEIRAEAAHSLGLIGAEGALAELIQNLVTDSAIVRRDCIRAIAGATDGTETELIEGLQSDNKDIRLGCALALAESGAETIETVLSKTDKISRDTIAIGLSLVSESEREAVLETASVDKEVEFTSSTMSTFFNSWADEYSSDLRYWLKKDDDESESNSEFQQATLD